MNGRLVLRGGVLFVGRQESTAHVAPYDLDGRPLGSGFSFGGPGEQRVDLRGLDVDGDRRIWIADRAAAQVRSFSVFGQSLGTFGDREDPRSDGPGLIREPSALRLLRSEDGVGEDPDAVRGLLVGSGGRRRHGVQLFDLAGHLMESLRPGGDPEGRFHRVVGLGARGRWILVCEAGPRRVQVFRDQQFHFAFATPEAEGRSSEEDREPVACAMLSDGRMLLLCGRERGHLLLLDGAGRLLRVLAGPSPEEGGLAFAADLAVEEGEGDRTRRIAVIDRDAERVQVFTLEGACYGAFERLPGSGS